MAKQSLTVDVTEKTFEQEVIVASQTRPVVVDFWAPWCGPCRALGPILERVIESMDGRAALVKVNVDENRMLAGRYQIRSIPAVKVFVNGQVAGEFVGAAPEPEVRRQLEALLPKAGAAER